MRATWLSLCSQTLLASRLARVIATDSHFSAGAICRALRVPATKVAVLYPGVNDRYFVPTPPASIVRIKEKYGLDRYVLAVGVLSPQKNVGGIVRAYARARPSETALALAGRDDGPYYEDVIRPLTAALGVEHAVHKLGVVPLEDLAALYAGGEALLYPSFAEGFGLPPLEAMASGTPVIASTSTSLPEVLGDAACLVDPHDVDALATSLLKVVQDRPLREKLIQRGRMRAAGFRWDRMAREALKLYAAIA
jgi:glycosyltransferase involved in cell wall biosynthesis